MKTPLKLLSPLCLLALIGCAADDIESTVIEGTWQTEEFTDSESGETTDIIYAFYDDEFSELISVIDDDDNYDLEESEGTFTISEETITTDDGYEAYQIDFTYDRDENSIKYDIVYIGDDAIYFGNANPTSDEDCGDDTYEVITADTSISNGVVTSTEESTCYARPTTVNFGLPYYNID